MPRIYLEDFITGNIMNMLINHVTAASTDKNEDLYHNGVKEAHFDIIPLKNKVNTWVEHTGRNSNIEIYSHLIY